MFYLIYPFVGGCAMLFFQLFNSRSSVACVSVLWLSGCGGGLWKLGVLLFLRVMPWVGIVFRKLWGFLGFLFGFRCDFGLCGFSFACNGDRYFG